MDSTPQMREEVLGDQDEKMARGPEDDDFGFCKNDYSISTPISVPTELADTGKMYNDREDLKMQPFYGSGNHAQSLLIPSKCGTSSLEADNASVESGLKARKNMHTVIGIPNEYDLFYRYPNVPQHNVASEHFSVTQDRSIHPNNPQYLHAHSTLQPPTLVHQCSRLSSSADAQGEEEQQLSSKGSLAASLKEGESDGLVSKKKKQERNRESAKKCRKRKKEYLIKLEAEIKALRDELAVCKNQLETARLNNEKTLLRQKMSADIDQFLLQAKSMLNSSKPIGSQHFSDLLNTFNVTRK